MTCIVGLKYKGKVYIGADSLGSDSSFNKVVRADEKVFKKGEMIFGFTTSYRMGQILRYAMTIPTRPEGIDDMEYLVAHFIPTLITAYDDGGWIANSKSGARTGGTFLLGYRKELYKIENDFQVGKPVENYESCGCGQDFAKGSLFSTNNLKMEPDARILMALHAATKHSAGVDGPYTIIEI